MAKEYRILVRRATLFLGLILTISDGISQTAPKNIHDRTQLWLGFFNQSRYSKRLGSWIDVHYRRTDDFIDKPLQFIIRGAGTYYIKDNFRFMAGYAYARHFPARTVTVTRHEHRPWQQLWWSQKHNGINTQQRLRLEERFISKVSNNQVVNGFTFHFRLTYNLTLFIPLKGLDIVAKTPFIVISDEIMINMGKRIIYNYFDQNRFFAGFGYQFTNNLNMQLGYMNSFQQEFSGNNYLRNHTIRCFVYHTLDFRKKESN